MKTFTKICIGAALALVAVMIIYGGKFFLSSEVGRSDHYVLSPSWNIEALRPDLIGSDVEIFYKGSKVADGLWTAGTLDYTLKIPYGQDETDYTICFIKDGEKLFEGPALASDISSDPQGRKMLKDSILNDMDE